jgi:predicted acylesterase/phospholipase RssA
LGLTLIRKRTGAAPKNARVALVLAGGAVTGGAFKVGGLQALDDFLVGRRVNELDIYVGLSAGSVLAVPLAAGISPNEMGKVLDGSSRRFDQLRPLDFYQPNLKEWIGRPARFAYELLSYGPVVAGELMRQVPELRQALLPAWRRLLRRPDYTRIEQLAIDLIDHFSDVRALPSPTDYIPSGLLDSAGLERWLRRNLEKTKIPNDFDAFTAHTGRELYLCACNLDTAEQVVFGPRTDHGASISQAVQASTALPGFYRPARIGDVDYVDGGIRRTANVEVAIEQGADLIICYNPFRPFVNRHEESGEYLSDRGLKAVLNQAIRTMLHSRLTLGLQRYLHDDRFQGDIVLLEPGEEDLRFFGLNPLAFWHRDEALEHGFQSVRCTIETHYDELQEVLSAYGLDMCRSTASRRAARAQPNREPQLRAVS